MCKYFTDKALNELYAELSQPLHGGKQCFDLAVASPVSDAVYVRIIY